MPVSVLYLGDTSLLGAAAYLAGLIHRAGWALDYVPSHLPADAELFDQPRSLYVLSDYPASRLSLPLQQRLVQAVDAGAGLLMIGGWESYHGCGGDWDQTAVAAALPVEISRTDDRVNCDQPALVRYVQDHPAVEGLPWISRPPCIGGFNRFQPKSDAKVLLETQRFRAFRDGEDSGSSPSGAIRCWWWGRMVKAVWRRWPPTLRRIGSAAWSTGATAESPRRPPAPKPSK